MSTPEAPALKLAHALETPGADFSCSDVAAELRRQHAEIERLTAERDALRAALAELRDRIKSHPAYADLSGDAEEDIGGDLAEFSYLARLADAALGDARLSDNSCDAAAEAHKCGCRRQSA